MPFFLFDDGTLFDASAAAALFGTDAGPRPAALAEGGKAGLLFSLTGEELWRADQWAGLPLYERAPAFVLCGGERVEAWAYAPSPHARETRSPEPPAAFRARLAKNRLGLCDLFLMTPCCLEGYAGKGKAPAGLAAHLLSSVARANRNEFGDDFVRMLKRDFLGLVSVGYKEAHDRGETVQSQPALAFLTEHPGTKTGIVTLMLPAASLDGHLVLDRFRAGLLFVFSEDGTSLPLADWIAKQGISPCGTARSLVFAENPLSDEQILGALVCEAAPMGRLVGRNFLEILQNDLAQYDIARAFASEHCMIEIHKTPTFSPFLRVEIEALEIFFLELLLLQDAAISRVCRRIRDEMEKERSRPFRRDSMDVLDRLTSEMSEAILFLDFRCFIYPTVAASAERISRCFGLDRLLATYHFYQETLAKLIDIHKTRREDLETRMLNGLLLIIAMTQIIPIFRDIFMRVQAGEFSAADGISWAAGAGVCFLLWLLFRLLRRMRARALGKRKNRP